MGGGGVAKETDWVEGLKDPPGRGGAKEPSGGGWGVGGLAVHHKEVE